MARCVKAKHGPGALLRTHLQALPSMASNSAT